MSYEPTNWKTGDVVTSAKLNKLENAVASGGAMIVEPVLVAPEDGDPTFVTNYTFAQIEDAYISGQSVIYHKDSENYVDYYPLINIHDGKFAPPTGHQYYMQFSIDANDSWIAWDGKNAPVTIPVDFWPYELSVDN